MKLGIYTDVQEFTEEGLSDTIENLTGNEVVNITTDHHIKDPDDHVDDQIMEVVNRILPDGYDHDIIDTTCIYSNYDHLVVNQNTDNFVYARSNSTAKDADNPIRDLLIDIYVVLETD